MAEKVHRIDSHNQNVAATTFNPFTQMKIFRNILFWLIGWVMLASPCWAYLDLTTDTWMSRDPMGQAAGPNPYTYVSQNPWTKFDPMGLSDAWPWPNGSWTAGDWVRAPFHAVYDSMEVPRESLQALKQAQADAWQVGAMRSTVDHNPNAVATSSALEKQVVQNTIKNTTNLATSVPLTTLTGGVTPESGASTVATNTERELSEVAATNSLVSDAAHAAPGASAKADSAVALLTVSKEVNPWAGATTSSVTKDTETMYRVWGGDAQQQGAWLTPIKPTSAEQAKAQLALPTGNTAQYISEVKVPKGTRVQSGTAAANFNQPGGGQQVKLIDNIPSSAYGKPQPLPATQ